MDAGQARQLKIKTGALTRTIKDVTSYNVEKAAQEAKIEEIKQEQAALPEDAKDSGLVNAAQAALAETVVVIPTIIAKVEQWMGDLEGVMGTIEEACADNMDAIRETPEWIAAQTAMDNAQQFAEQ